MNNSKILGIVVLVVILAAAAWWSFRQPNRINQSAEKSGEMRNAEMLATEAKYQITGSDVSYFENSKGYFVKPQQEGSYPGVVMIHENRGLRPEIKAMADQLGQAGYMVLAVDLFGGQVVEAQDQARQLTASFNQETGTKNMQAAANYLKQQGATKLASLGWCFGGRQSIELAISGQKLDATVVYYGGNMASTKDKLAPIKWPVLGIFGDKDTAVPVEKVREFETSLNELGVENEIYIYPGVGHAFANPSGMNYAPNETKDAWSKTITFLEKHLK